MPVFSADPSLYAAIFERASEPILAFDPLDDRILAANPAACRLLGHSGAELSAMRMSSLHPSQLPSLMVFTEAVLHRGKGWTRALSVTAPDGSDKPLEYLASAIEIEGRPAVVAILGDLDTLYRRGVDSAADAYLRMGIAEWRQVERVFQSIERENQLILRAAGEGIYGVNAEGKTTFINPAGERILGWTAKELVGQRMHDTVHHTHADGRHYEEAECPIYAAFRDGVTHRVEDDVLWRRDGTPIRVEYTSTPIRDGNRMVGAVIVFRDITARKEAEERLRAALEEVEQLRQRLELENAYLQEEIMTERNHLGIIGKSAAIQHLRRQIELVAPTDATVLISGESGTGKELIARAVHLASRRGDRPIIRVNCAAVPPDLFESEFFGHTRGAFTGALRDRVGRFELADGGTLFLDEVGEIPLNLQGKLLRVLQESHFERVGEERTRKTDVRVIAATNVDLKRQIERGRFREDLYYRLNVFPIVSTPLRERADDIALLAAHFVEGCARRLNLPDLRLSQGDVERLTRYGWPGNVRELQNVIERAAILSKQGRLHFDLPDARTRIGAPSHRQPAAVADDGPILTEAARRDRDRASIVAALHTCNGRVFGSTGAAALLGVKPTTLASRIKALGIAKGAVAS